MTDAIKTATNDARRETCDVRHDTPDVHLRGQTSRVSRLTSQKRVWVLGLLLIAAIAAIAWWRVGLLDLPAVPPGLTAEASGLVGLQDMKRLNEAIWNAGSVGTDPAPTGGGGEGLSDGARLVQQGLGAYQRGDVPAALDLMRQGIRRDPDSLVLANAYRVVVFRARREFLQKARREGHLTPQFPPELSRQPIAFFEELVREHNSRETKLQLALAWVDEMLLFPALEIKAPASVQAVDILSGIIDQGNPGYIPALMARGLNHLHRPSRLVWPESARTPPDAAAQDIGLCVAIGRRFGGVSPRVQATLAMLLGDACVKADRLSVARSWWQIAQNLCHDDDLQAAIRRRYGWSNDEILDRLEEELDRSRSELDHPMTDLAWVWN